MANWFKLYESDLDETRMRFALGKLPECWPVWTALLMECCKCRGDTFDWGTSEQELFGFSDRLKISIGKINLAIQILTEIKYIEIKNGKLKVLKWNEKQDDYLARKTRGDYAKLRKSRRVSDNRRESPREESRGDESRSDQKRESTTEQPPLLDVPKKKFQKPTLEQVTQAGLPTTEAERFLNYYESNGWMVGKNPMKSWEGAVRNWSRNLNGKNGGSRTLPPGIIDFARFNGDICKGEDWWKVEFPNKPFSQFYEAWTAYEDATA